MATVGSDTNISQQKDQPSHSDNKDGSKNTEHNHPIVGDRVIEGEGTSQEAWQNWQGLHDLPKLDIAGKLCADSAAPRPVEAETLTVFGYVSAPHPDDEILGCAGLLQKQEPMAILSYWFMLPMVPKATLTLKFIHPVNLQ